ncbi:hypothetical protein LWI29_026531 [Acer saccharum]|uniref:Uncharacterized protein n=1 Tax=Acer saccharum TaxID=4024 RepID=A0AA39RLG7_ACESA|nr:hypothetical protein LWI29_026531 [Acer saccharum]
MVRDLTLEFRAYKENFGSDDTYTRRTSYHPRKRTRAEDPFDPTTEFQTMLPYSPTALIPYPTPLRVAKPPKDSSDPDATDSETSSD